VLINAKRKVLVNGRMDDNGLIQGPIKRLTFRIQFAGDNGQMFCQRDAALLLEPDNQASIPTLASKLNLGSGQLENRNRLG